MNRALKCSVCSTIQFKGERCAEDGSILIECDLNIENNAQSEFESKIIRLINKPDLKNDQKNEEDYEIERDVALVVEELVLCVEEKENQNARQNLIQSQLLSNLIITSDDSRDDMVVEAAAADEIVFLKHAENQSFKQINLNRLIHDFDKEPLIQYR